MFESAALLPEVHIVYILICAVRGERRSSIYSVCAEGGAKSLFLTRADSTFLLRTRLQPSQRFERPIGGLILPKLVD